MVKPNPIKLKEEAVDFDQLLTCAMDHKAAHLSVFLKNVGLPSSGIREELKERLRYYLHLELNNPTFLTEYLNLIEGWGNQHIYLYNVPDVLCKLWQDEARVKAILSVHGHSGVLNRPRPIVLPESPTLSSIHWTPKLVRFIWNEKRVWLEKQEFSDTESDDGQIILKAFKRNVSRGTLAFDWNLKTGEAMIMIQKLPKGTGYESVRDGMIGMLKPIIDLSALEPIRVHKAIKPIIKSGEVRERRTKWVTAKNAQVSFTSPGKKQSVGSDETLRLMESVGTKNLHGDYGNMYWLPQKSGELESELHAVIHKKDQRISIMGEREEVEIRYVSGRIRAHC